MWPFRRRKKEEEPPPSLNDLHSFAEPMPGQYPTAQPAGQPTYATQRGVDLPDIPNQDRILVHWLRPPGDENPERWYADRNSDKNFRDAQQNVNGTTWPSYVTAIPRGADPRWTPVAVDRLTAYNAPTNGYSMVRPYDQDVERRLNGVHFSMADNRRTYDVGGMNPVKRHRNTYRLQPPTLDATSVDLASMQQPQSQPAIYVSPQPAGYGRSYRLGG